jgi:urate oxidase
MVIPLIEGAELLAILKFNSYGKTRVRLTQVLRNGDQHEVVELSAKILFRGQFEKSYTKADNSVVLPTDTIKNTVYVVARKMPIQSIEQFSRDLAQHFLTSVPHLEMVKIELQQAPWNRIQNHGSAFVSGGLERRVAMLTATRETEHLESGVHGLEILKTAKSAFSDYMVDEFTTIPPTRDRLFGTVMDADWSYREGLIDYNAAHAQIRDVLLSTFAEHVSESVQHTLFDMAKAALAEVPLIKEIHLVMPNKHRLLVDLSKFKLSNPNQLFVPTDEPSGYIEARVTAD